MTDDEKYPIGTDEIEAERLGLQYRVWRDVILDCWQNAGIATGKRVLDIGAGPGHATVDLAEIVGATGEVVAVECVPNFIAALEESVRAQSLTNVRVHQLDIAMQDLPGGDFDFAWSRLVAGFMSDLPSFIRKIARALRPGGVAIFHEFAQYNTWRFSPSLPMQERFVAHLLQQHRRRVGHANVALQIPPLLARHGFVIRAAVPRIFCLRPNDPMWAWPIAFSSAIATGDKLTLEQGQFVKQLEQEFAQAKANPNALMMTPLILEIVAEKT